MDDSVRLLLISRQYGDEALIKRELREAGFDVHLFRVENAVGVTQALTAFSPNIVIAVDGIAALPPSESLNLVRELSPHLPYLLVTGDSDLEAALGLIRAGASDVVLRAGIERLQTAVPQAMQQKRTELALKQNAEMFELITHNVSDLIAILDVNGKRLYNSLSYLKVLGEWDALAGTDSFQEIHESDRERIREVFERTIKTGAGERAEYRFVRKDGTVRYIESQGSVIRDDKGNVDKILVVSRDVTAKREADYQLQLLAYALTCTKDCIALTDLEDNILFVNEAFTDTYGYGEDELAGKSISLIRSPLTPTEVLESILTTTVTQGEWSGEIFNRRKDGSDFPIELRSSLVRDGDGHPIATISVARDISDRKQTEEDLRASEERYRQFFEEDLTGDFISTPDGRLLDCNPAFIRMFGYASIEEARETNLADLYPTANGRDKFLQLLLEKRKLEYYEVELKRRDGSMLYVVENAIGIFDKDGTLVRIKGYLFDNTRRKELETRLIQSQKMEAVGKLAGGIAHEFNNVLTAIMTAAETVRSRSTEQDVLRLARMIESSSMRGASIAKQLLQFARPESSQLTPTSLREVILNTRKILDHSFPKTISIEIISNVPDAYIMGDPVQLQQMLMNLCLNARDSMSADEMEPTGLLTISLDVATGDFVRHKFGRAATDFYYVVCISDTGKGMSAEVSQRIFEPFYSTKGIGQGTGLGLSVVHGVIVSHQGHIDVEAGPGKGAKFILYFPSIQHTPQGAVALPSAEPGKGETLLIVEDEDDVRMLLKEWTTEAGYVILEARDGEEALRVFRDHADDIQLVLTDIGLPKLGGSHLFRELLRIRKTTKVLFCTGYADDSIRNDLLDNGAFGIIQKPFRVADVLSCIRSALDTEAYPIRNGVLR